MSTDTDNFAAAIERVATAETDKVFEQVQDMFLSIEAMNYLEAEAFIEAVVLFQQRKRNEEIRQFGRIGAWLNRNHIGAPNIYRDISDILKKLLAKARVRYSTQYPHVTYMDTRVV